MDKTVRYDGDGFVAVTDNGKTIGKKVEQLSSDERAALDACYMFANKVKVTAELVSLSYRGVARSDHDLPKEENTPAKIANLISENINIKGGLL